jgi:hypothetical protein
LLKRSVMLLQDLEQGFAQILYQVPAVGNLDCLRRAAGCTLNRDLAAIAADDFDLWVRAKPVGHLVSGAVIEQRNRSMGIEINDDGAVTMRLSLGPVVDTTMERWWWSGYGSPARKGKQQIDASRHREVG